MLREIPRRERTKGREWIVEYTEWYRKILIECGAAEKGCSL